MRIGELSRQSGIPVDTLRYYEKEKLLTPPPRSAAGYREYPVNTLKYLQFIHNAKAVGFSLKECRQLLAIFNRRDEHTCQEVKQLANNKRDQLAQQMQRLQVMQDTLNLIADACCGGSESAIHCSILNKLDKPEGEPE